MIKYRVRRHNSKNETLITPMEFDKETEFFLVKDGRRTSKRSEWENYFDSFDEAKDYIIKQQERKIEIYQYEIETASSILKQAQSLTE